MDFMTTYYARLLYESLDRLSRRIVNEVDRMGVALDRPRPPYPSDN